MGSTAIHGFMNQCLQELEELLQLLPSARFDSPRSHSNLFPSLSFTGAPIQICQVRMDRASRCLPACTHLCRDIPHHTMSFRLSLHNLKTFSVNNILHRHLHTQFPGPTHSTFYISLQILYFVPVSSLL